MGKRRISISAFITGFFTGIVVSVLIIVGLASYLIRHPQKVVVKIVDLGMNRVVEKTVQSMPKDYIGQHQNEIATTAQRFARAFSQNRISQTQMNELAKRFFAIVADQQITPAEIDDLLRLMNRYAN